MDISLVKLFLLSGFQGIRRKIGDIQGNEGIKIYQYLEPDIPALAKTILKPITSQVNEFNIFIFNSFQFPVT